VMPTLHAGFSFGALAGSAAAGFAAGHGWSPGRHLTVAAAIVVAVLFVVLKDVPGAKPERTKESAVSPYPAPVRRLVLWLLAGLATAFPLALSLAGDAGKRADGTGGAREIGFVTAVAYTGFLAGPPIVGGIAQATSYGVAFVFVALTAALIVPAVLAAYRARR